MPSWPSSLPHLNAGLKDQRGSGFLRTPMDMGPAKMRRRYSAVPRFLTGSMVFTAAQRAAFDTFYSTTLEEGSAEFTFEDPVDFSEKTVRFAQEPSFTALSGDANGVTYWNVSISLEVLP
jgi:hypothetical protein